MFFPSLHFTLFPASSTIAAFLYTFNMMTVSRAQDGYFTSLANSECLNEGYVGGSENILTADICFSTRIV